MKLKGNKNMLIIPDAHAAPEYDSDRFTALGNYIVKHKPEIIVCLGDFADMPSLSSYNKEKQYKPRLFMCLGNHEDRIDRAVNSAPELEGAISIKDLQYEKFGWKLTPFKRTLTIEGIIFSHYFTSGVAGRPISSSHIGHQLVSKLHCSAVQGHSHLYNHAEQTRPDGQKIFGLSAGCFSHPHYSESWCRDTEYTWWRGVVSLNGLDGEGYYDEINAVTQRKLLREYL
jgi:predicted phosphodiesterase